MTTLNVLGIIGAVFGIAGIGGVVGVLKMYRKKVIEETRLKDKVQAFHERLDRVKKELAEVRGNCVMGKQNASEIEKTNMRVSKLEDESKENAERFGKIEKGLDNIEKNVTMLVDNLINNKD